MYAQKKHLMERIYLYIKKLSVDSLSNIYIPTSTLCIFPLFTSASYSKIKSIKLKNMKRRNFIFDIFSIGLISSMTPKVNAKKLYKLNNMVRSISTWKTTEANLKAGLMLDKGIDGLTATLV